MINTGKNVGYEVLTSEQGRPCCAKDKDVILEVDTGLWFVFYNGSWYPQGEEILDYSLDFSHGYNSQYIPLT